MNAGPIESLWNSQSTRVYESARVPREKYCERLVCNKLSSNKLITHYDLYRIEFTVEKYPFKDRAVRK